MVCTTLYNCFSWINNQSLNVNQQVYQKQSSEHLSFGAVVLILYDQRVRIMTKNVSQLDAKVVRKDL